MLTFFFDKENFWSPLLTSSGFFPTHLQNLREYSSTSQREVIRTSFSLEDVSLMRISKFPEKTCSSFVVVQSPSRVRPYGLQCTRPPCPSPSPKACPSSCPLSKIKNLYFVYINSSKTKTVTRTIFWVSSICRCCAEVFTCFILFNFHIIGI